MEKSAGAIIFRRENNQIFYLLLYYPSSVRAPKQYWDFPKGHVEKGETEAMAMRREVFEETGIKDLELAPKFRKVIKYFFTKENKTIFKIVVFYLGKTEEKDVEISNEHLGYKWLPYEEAFEQLTFDNAKEILKKANNLLSEKGL